MPEQLTIFFSYSHEDSAFVLRLSKDLRAAGAQIWVDQLDIGAGQHWDKAVENALRSCPKQLVVLSPAAVNSANVMDEVSFALEEHKQIIPVILRNCDVPLRLRRMQYIDFRAGYDNGLTKLLRELEVQQGPSTAATFSQQSRPTGSGNPAAAPALIAKSPGLETAKKRAPLTRAIPVVSVAILLCLVLAIVVPRLLSSEMLDRFPDGVLVAAGVIPALLLFSLMRGFGRGRTHARRILAEIAAACLFGALVAFVVDLRMPASAFDLIISVHSAGAPSITSGTVRLEFGNAAVVQPVNPLGKVDFEGIPVKYRGTSARVLPKIEGYQEQYQQIVMSADVLQLELAPLPKPAARTTAATGKSRPVGDKPSPPQKNLPLDELSRQILLHIEANDFKYVVERRSDGSRARASDDSSWKGLEKMRSAFGDCEGKVSVLDRNLQDRHEYLVSDRCTLAVPQLHLSYDTKNALDTLGFTLLSTHSKEEFEGRTRLLIAMMAANQFEGVRAMYTKSMSYLTADGLRNNWNEKVQSFGPFAKVVSAEKDLTQDVVVAYCAFGNDPTGTGQVRLEVRFDASLKEITALYLGRATNPRSIPAPN